MTISEPRPPLRRSGEVHPDGLNAEETLLQLARLQAFACFDTSVEEIRI
jgi:hypothetical protein